MRSIILALCPLVWIIAYAVARIIALGRKSWSLVALMLGLFFLFVVVWLAQARLYHSITGIRQLGHDSFFLSVTFGEELISLGIVILVLLVKKSAGQKS